MIERFKKINGLTLKILACLTMLVDHIAAGIMVPWAREGIIPQHMSLDDLNKIYFAMRCIGRCAFPIFCFLLVEGFIHTRNRLRYALSLLIFAFISEVPFDILFHSKYEQLNINVAEVISANREIFSEQCNVYFTLFFGLLTIWAIDYCYRLFMEKNLPVYLNGLTIAAFTGLSCFLTIKIDSDYDFHGILLIVIFYVLRNMQPLNLLAGYIAISSYSIEFWSFPAFLCMVLYNHKRGPNIGYFKYLFYLFYPLHLTILYIYRCIM
ncbi:MAG: conjugal transfer protein TraX [Butyrivibrio sp.]|nr:conjugal transfer protein TraX [Butyrivibrio sp.]